MERSELQKNKIGKIILAKVLEMPLKRYLIYIQETINEKGNPLSTIETLKKTILCESND